MLGAPSPSKTFLGVTFVLFGFDPDTHRNVRAKLVSSGGVDAGQYGPSCTHVVVGGKRIVYDDPFCVTARDDGKVVVTGLWVDHSYDIGILADTSSIMYRPVRDLNGIPDAKSMVMCLTGYQRQDREDIMMMVSFMGAQFSKPLVAHKVTHLICYKFEGEKYELAKRMKIKLVNHRWLEDCLRDWEILSEANYNKCTYELEMMEAEAKDSEEDYDDKFVEQPRENVIKRSPCTLRVGIPTYAGESSKGLNDNTDVQPSSNVLNVELKSTPTREIRQPSGITKINSPVMLGVPNLSSLNESASNNLNEASERTSSPVIKKKELTPSKDLEEAPHVDENVRSLSYSRKGSRRTSRDMQDGFVQIQNEIASDDVNVPAAASGVLAGGSKGKSPLKRKLEASSAISKSPKMDLHINPSNSGAPIIGNTTQGPEVSALMCQPLMASDNFCLDQKEMSPNNIADSAAVQREIPFTSATKSSSSGESRIKSVGLGTDKKTAAHAFEKIVGVGKPDIVALETDEVMEGSTKKLALDASSSKRLEEDIITSPKQGNADMLDRESDKADENQTRKTAFGRKKTLGSRPKLSKSANLKGSIYLKKDVSSDKPLNSLTGREEMAVPDNSSDMNDGEACLPLGNFEALDGVREISADKSRDRAQDAAVCMDDETQAPDEDDNVLEKKNNGEDHERVEMPQAANASNEAESVHDASNILGPNTCDDVEKADDAGKHKNGILVSEATNVKGKSTEGTKTSLANKKQKATSSAKQRADGNEMEEQKRPEANKRTKSRNNFEVSPEAEKENKAGANADPSVSRGKVLAHKSSLNSSEKTATKKNDEAGETNATSTRKVDRRTEPALFILSGHSHRQRRKEFQQVIRRLRGRVCRDSRQWSYQATHFIAPDPIRRTEKFFAAAASGRWILRDDYLDASSQAGKFIDEEPYEWQGNSLSEDGTINLEAPRKWRLLREKTGHGAFYDMQVIIYGECITPPLDTLKRAVKAGDGTILATSPPYSRFLNKGVDFAIVSPGMPRVDIWVQEFLKHEIPCVVADYLVEYVCKPGYPLEKHVLYNTHTWTEKSLSRLQKKAEEIVDPGSSDADGGELSCEVCGSTDRGDVMLICGDECGSVGCGIGTHIDCCDPPLEAVPEENWFCPNCSKSRNRSSSGSATKSKRRGSVLRSKR